MKCKVTLVPTSGLCNRMNTILSAMSFVKEYGDKYPVHIFWEKSKECFADFEELFRPIVKEHITFNKLTKFWMQPNRRENLHIPFYMRKFIYDKEFTGNDIRNVDFESAIGGVKIFT